MDKVVVRLEHSVGEGVKYLSNAEESKLIHKSRPGKWSKKEILGHLIDSAINNLQRVTEMQFEEKPFRIHKYKQEELVKANDYQNADLQHLIHLWQSLNVRILDVMSQQTEESLNYSIVLDNDELSDLRFLMTDYVQHLEHHLRQIMA